MDLNSTFADSLANLINPLPEKLAIAVSGGGDSLALLFLVNQFMATNPIDITVITVDHAIRAESTKEAKYVEETSANLGIKHVTLKWEREQNTSIMHANAREARYNLMTDYCFKQGIDTILTAHHADDKIESLFIRLSKASGLFGLSPAESNLYNNVKILRPLSNIYKKDLMKYLSSLDVDYFEDPSNYDSKYQRSNIRKWIDMMPEELQPELFKRRIIKSLEHIKESADYMGDLFRSSIAERAVIHESGYASYSFKEEYSYIEFMILSHLLTMVSGYDFTPRAHSVKTLYNKLNSKENAQSTLHGCIIVRKNNEVIIYRSFGKNKPVDVPLDKNIKWDNRWRSKIDDANFMVGNLSMEDYVRLKAEGCCGERIEVTPSHQRWRRNLRTHEIDSQASFSHNDVLGPKINRNILLTIPVIYEKNISEIKIKKIIAIPHIGYYNDFRYGEDVLIFEPNYTSRLIHFF